MSPNPSDITLVTCDNQLALAASDRVLHSVLEAAGVCVNVASWRDKAFDWSATRMAVLRSAWDSHLRAAEFRDWLMKVSSMTALCNPAPTVRWNFDKHYLMELQDAGVVTIPSIYVASHSNTDFAKHDIPWDRAVVKPAIGGSSYGVRRFDVDTQIEALNDHVRALRCTGALLQRFEPTVETLFERSLIFIDGRFTHAVLRVPFNQGNTPDSDEFDHKPSSGEIAFSMSVLKSANAMNLPFARVDLLPISDGIVLMELELIDPSLFLTRSNCAAQKLGACLLTRLESLSKPVQIAQEFRDRPERPKDQLRRTK